MLSESARMSSAAEARFRIRTPASSGRAVSVVALDAASDGVVARLATRSGTGLTVFQFRALMDGTTSVVGAAAATDLVVMVVTAGGDAQAAATIGEACSRDRVMTTSIVIRPASVTDETLSRTLAQVRPWSLMVVIASDEAYVEDVLRSFR